MSRVNNSNTKKLIRSKSGLRIVAADESFKSPFLLSEPHWIPDKDAPNCRGCGIKFGFTTRRHHCRRCGQVYCSSCCEQKMALPRMSFIDPVRICENCIPVTVEENKFFDEQVKTLINGATFILEDQIFFASADVLQCKLSVDHRQLLFDGVKLAPLDFSTIQTVRVNKDIINGVKGVEIEYNESEGEGMSCVKLATTPEIEHRKTGAMWIAAMQQDPNNVKVRGKFKKLMLFCSAASLKSQSTISLKQALGHPFREFLASFSPSGAGRWDCQ